MTKRADAAVGEPSLLDNEAFRRTLDNMLEGCQLIDADARYLYVNAAAARHGRQRIDQLIGRTMPEVYPGIERTLLFAELRRCMEQNVAVNMENEFVYPDGSTALFELRIEPMPDGVFVLSIDISERREAQRALESVAVRYRNLLDASFDAVAISRVGILREVNAGFLRVFGYEREDEVLGQPVTLFAAPESRADLARRVADSVEGTFEFVGLRRDGKKILLEATSKNDILDGAPARITALRDITEKRLFEAQFHEAQKMEAIGRLAGGVAHDFNNLLTVISGHTDLLLRSMEAGDVRQSDLEQVSKAASAAAALTRQLLAFSRREVIQPRTVLLGDIVLNAQRILARVIGEDVELATVLGDEPCPVHVDPGQIEQVLINLAVNARDAMPTGGTLRIETSVTELDAELARTYWQTTPGRFALLAVSDTGTGMDAATRARMFEPFFTTKGHGKGTGLGLSIVYGVVKQAGGVIGVDSEPGAGTSFKIYLPLLAGAAVTHTPAAGSAALSVGSETILLVEDSDAVRAVARRVLENLGYDVVPAATGAEALAILERGVQIDLLLTDVVMPQMSGSVLAERFLRTNPDAKVIYMSGYTDDAVVRHGVLSAGNAYVQKPFTPFSLGSKVREVLDAGR